MRQSSHFTSRLTSYDIVANDISAIYDYTKKAVYITATKNYQQYEQFVWAMLSGESTASHYDSCVGGDTFIK